MSKLLPRPDSAISRRPGRGAGGCRGRGCLWSPLFPQLCPAGAPATAWHRGHGEGSSASVPRGTPQPPRGPGHGLAHASLAPGVLGSAGKGGGGATSPGAGRGQRHFRCCLPCFCPTLPPLLRVPQLAAPCAPHQPRAGQPPSLQPAGAHGAPAAPPSQAPRHRERPQPPPRIGPDPPGSRTAPSRHPHAAPLQGGAAPLRAPWRQFRPT